VLLSRSCRSFLWRGRAGAAPCSPPAAATAAATAGRLLGSHGRGWESIDRWRDEARLRRIPYALAALSEQHGRVPVGLRG
jgi:hypothetical protein